MIDEEEKKRLRLKNAMVAAKDRALAIESKYYEVLTEKPLLCVPPRLRPVMLQVWACHRHLTGLETALSIAASVGTWISEFGLDEADAVEILRQMVHPASMARHNKAGDLITDMSRLALNAMKVKKRRAEAAERERILADTPKGDPATLGKLSELIDSIGNTQPGRNHNVGTRQARAGSDRVDAPKR